MIRWEERHGTGNGSDIRQGRGGKDHCRRQSGRGPGGPASACGAGGYGYQVPPTNGFGYNGASMGQPAPNPVFQQQAQSQQNPQTGYNPQTTGYAYNPNQPAQPNMANTVPTQSGQSATQPAQVQPQQSAPGSIAPDSQQATTDGNTTNVTAKFQA